MTATTCARCEGNEFAPPECTGCLAEVAHARQEARDDIVRHLPTGHGIRHGLDPYVTLRSTR